MATCRCSCKRLYLYLDVQEAHQQPKQVGVAREVLDGLLALGSTTAQLGRPRHPPWSWCGVVWCGVVWCGVVWCGVVWCGVVWCGVVWCGVVWCGVVEWGGVVWCGVVWCGVVRCGVVWWSGVEWCGVGGVECGEVWCGVVGCGVVVRKGGPMQRPVSRIGRAKPEQLLTHPVGTS